MLSIPNVMTGSSACFRRSSPENLMPCLTDSQAGPSACRYESRRSGLAEHEGCDPPVFPRPAIPGLLLRPIGPLRLDARKMGKMAGACAGTRRACPLTPKS